MANFFKKKVAGSGQTTTAGIRVSDSEAALAQSDFNVDKITEIQNKFTLGSVLTHPGRIFIREGLLWKVCRKGPKKRHFFLFNDILVYGSVVANRFSNQHILPLAQMSVSAECFYQPLVNADFDEESEQMELDVANAFQISHANKSFHVFALSAVDKSNWLANLHKHINKASLSSSSDQQMVPKPVWVPDSTCKECMLCNIKFTAFVRKHHCRRCGRLVCSSCSPHRMNAAEAVAGSNNSDLKERACKDCFKEKATVVVGGVQAAPPRPPPPSIAAQTVSNALQSATAARPQPTKLPESHSNIESDKESSTDTEDSDDSENEKETESSKAFSKQVPVQPSTEISKASTELVSETQPTPPPRKKKLKKKLENLGNDLLHQTAETRQLPSKVDKQQNQELSEQELETACTNKDVSEEDYSPKKSRRRKKHQGCLDHNFQETEGNSAEVDDSGNNKDGNAEDVSEIKDEVDDSGGDVGGVADSPEQEGIENRKKRTRKNKFK